MFLLAVLLNFGIRDLDNQVKSGSSGLHQWTSVVGTSVSGFFLYLIAGLNIVILVSILRVFRDLRRGSFDNDELDEQLNKRGLMNRLLGGFARKIDTPWKMYPVGVLFGLGFDTATEVALLVLSGTAVASGLPFYAILSLPVLFAAGMCLFDTLDGCFMNFAYGWAFSRPIRKVYYNIIITGLSVAVAFVIGTIELVGLLSTEFNLHGAFWDTMAELQHQSGRVHHRGDVRGHLGGRPRNLAFRPYRGTLGPFGRSHQGRDRSDDASGAWPRGRGPLRARLGRGRIGPENRLRTGTTMRGAAEVSAELQILYRTSTASTPSRGVFGAS